MSCGVGAGVQRSPEMSLSPNTCTPTVTPCHTVSGTFRPASDRQNTHCVRDKLFCRLPPTSVAGSRLFLGVCHYICFLSLIRFFSPDFYICFSDIYAAIRNRLAVKLASGRPETRMYLFGRIHWVAILDYYAHSNWRNKMRIAHKYGSTMLGRK